MLVNRSVSAFLAIFFCSVPLFAGAPSPPTKPAPAAPAATSSPLLDKRAKLIGKWLNIRGDMVTFTGANTLSFTNVVPSVSPDLNGTFLLTPDLQLKITTNGETRIREFTVDNVALRIKEPDGTFAEYQRYDTKNLADLTLREVNMLDLAIDQWSIAKSRPPGSHPPSAELQKYIKKTTRLYYALNDPDGPKDFFGNPYLHLEVGIGPKVNPLTLQSLPGIPKTFWGRFIE
jgi:hypothetical protein